MVSSDKQFARLSRQQKTGFVLLLIFGILAVGLGFLQMRNTIYGPFALGLDTKAVKSSTFVDETTRLQQTDTDHDGLSDYEELEFYQTSPYLPDTDSDGSLDKVEIDSGEDPLCAKGEICRPLEAPTSTQRELVGSIVQEENNPLQFLEGFGQILDPGSAVGSGQAGGPQFDLNAVVNDPVALRKLIASTGKVSPEQLAQLDDQTLLGVAQEVFKDQNQGAKPPAPAGSGAAGAKVEN